MRSVVELDHPQLSVRRQCELLGLSRSSLYYEPASETAANLRLMRLIDQEYTAHPFLGSRRLTQWLIERGEVVNRKRVQRLMRLMGLEAIYQKPNTSRRHSDHKVYPYLLRGLIIDRPNQVWCADITYIPMAKGFVYLVAVMDWFSRRGWRGGFRSPWRPISASRRFRKRWPHMAGRKFSTLTRESSSPAPRSWTSLRP